ncbi:MAG: hypothetical protein DWQ36_00915 [Acidobacteria bacterium]|nr:MAG: hypothetical protein DWQ30_08920 [Acidobacteriota bacterium]REK11818.1 MAG: hypothetical protein DWQ36_00915 [Acidobacteriota bacterium]
MIASKVPKRRSTRSHPFRLPILLALLAVQALGSVASAGAAITALAVQDGRVIEYHVRQRFWQSLGHELLDTGLAGFHAEALAADASGELLIASGQILGTSTRHTVRIDLAPQSATLLASADPNLPLESLTFGPGGDLFALSGAGDWTIYRIDPGTGAATALLDLSLIDPFLRPGVLLATETDLYVIDAVEQSCALLRLDLVAVAVELVWPDVPCASSASTRHDEGWFLLLTNLPGGNLATYHVSIDRLDVTTGQIEHLDGRSEHFSVPEVHGLARARGTIAVVEVPVLDGAAARLTLVLLLALAAIWSLRSLRG